MITVATWLFCSTVSVRETSVWPFDGYDGDYSTSPSLMQVDWSRSTGETLGRKSWRRDGTDRVIFIRTQAEEIGRAGEKARERGTYIPT